MHRTTRLTSVGLVIVAALAATIAPASAATNTNRWVDADGHAGAAGCDASATAFTTIQAAVTASGADDTVIVCPGTYAEQVKITGDRAGLTLRSSTPFGATIMSPSSMHNISGANAIIGVVHVDDVTVRGFKVIARTQAPCEDVEAAIAVFGSQDAQIRGNRLLVPGVIGGDCFEFIGIAVGDTWVSDGSDARQTSATVASNEVRDALYYSIVAFSEGKLVDVDVLGNSVRAYFGSPPAGGPIITSGTAYFGIGAFGHVQGSIANNVIQGASGAPTSAPTFYAGIGTSPETTASNENGPIDIRDNIIRRVYNGIWAVQSDEVVIRRNHISNTYDGIILDDTVDTSVLRNVVSARQIGLSVTIGSSGNILRGNHVSGSGISCMDVSSGPGTAGTANTWAGNEGTVDGTPSGLCSAAP
jgi:parallel beta-helix repeat protein